MKRIRGSRQEHECQTFAVLHNSSTADENGEAAKAKTKAIKKDANKIGAKERKKESGETEV